MVEQRGESVSQRAGIVNEEGLACGEDGSEEGGGWERRVVIVRTHNYITDVLMFVSYILFTPEGRPGMSDVFLLSGISGLSFYSPFPSLVVLQ